MPHITPHEALTAAVEIAGSQTALAEICGVSQTAVWKWIQSSKRMPAEFVRLAEAATGVSRHDLRPDIYPRETMTDQAVGRRFTGVDQRADSGFPHAGHDSRIHAADHFNRREEMKAAR